MRLRRLFALPAGLLAAALLTQALAAPPGANPQLARLTLPPAAPLSAMAKLGQALFHDPDLSGTGRLSCASCHDPDHAYGPAGNAPVALGGPALASAGFRAVPSLRYLYRQPAFAIGPDSSGDNDQPLDLKQQAQQAAGRTRAQKSATAPEAGAANLVPQGGLFWDGRADTLQQQAAGPMFSHAEMDAGTATTVAAKLKGAHYAEDFQRLFGAGIFDQPDLAVSEAMFAIGRYEAEDPSFHPFSSKFDAWLTGKARFSAAEARGHAAFDDPRRGNCAACHLDKPSRDGLPPLFTDFQYEALGVPRNAAIPANRDPGFHDLGICGPVRTDMQSETQYCGMFLTPSLRNVATRRVFFHNGVFHSLDQVLDWYVNRDLDPARFYAKDADGKVLAYDDLPARFRANVDTSDAPFDRHPGEAPALSKAEMRDVIAFLKTLSDGYTPAPAVAAAPQGNPPGRESFNKP